MIACDVVQLEPQPAAVVKGKVGFEGLPDFFGEAFEAVMAVVQRQGAAIVGPPFAFYPEPPTAVVTLEAGFPLAGPIDPEGKVVNRDLPGATAITTIHVGPYDAMEKTYVELQAWMVANDHQPALSMWEVYLTDPGMEPDESKWQTQIVWPTRS